MRAYKGYLRPRKQQKYNKTKLAREVRELDPRSGIIKVLGGSGGLRGVRGWWLDGDERAQGRELSGLGPLIIFIGLESDHWLCLSLTP